MKRRYDHFISLEEGRFFLWLPVLVGVGIGVYFALPVEPDLWLSLGLAAGGFGLAFALAQGLRWFTLAIVLVSLVSGFALAKLRTETVRAPVLVKAKGSYTLTGRIERYQRLAGNRTRFLLSKLEMKGLAPDRTPLLVRIVSRIRQPDFKVGVRVKLRAVLRPPPGPERPGGYDFARKSWFEQLGGVGFAVSKAERSPTSREGGTPPTIERLRQIITNHIKDAVSGAGGAIVLALIVGDKSAIDTSTMEAIRAAGLAHMLAISGMHMALVAGTVYWLVRALLALCERLALQVDVRRPAAVLAIFAAAFYLLISGMGISTSRAFIMISIMFVAILAGRRAISLRNVALAALLILVLRPESLLSVGFQMSFAAVVALVAYYERGRGAYFRGDEPVFLLRWGRALANGARQIFVTTLIAGFAVAPIAVYHFHHLTSYSVLGNVLAMPILSLFVMPMALLVLIAMPFGLETWPLIAMSTGTEAILSVASWVAGLKAARVNVGTISLAALLFLVAGGLWLCLWRSSYRFAGLIVLAAGLLAAPFSQKPFLLIEREGRNLVFIDDAGHMWPVENRRARYSLDKWRSAFAADLHAHGNSTGNTAWSCESFGCSLIYKSKRITYSRHPGGLIEDCARANILVTTYPIPRRFPGCDQVTHLVDLTQIKKNGSYAFYLNRDRIDMVNARQSRGQRPWSRHR